jgi:hypothetical protein
VLRDGPFREWRHKILVVTAIGADDFPATRHDLNRRGIWTNDAKDHPACPAESSRPQTSLLHDRCCTALPRLPQGQTECSGKSIIWRRDRSLFLG